MPDVGAQSMLGGYALSHGAKNGSTGWCYDFVVGNKIWDGQNSPEGWYNVGFCAMQVVSMVGLLLVIYCNDRAARRGDYESTKRLILPVYHQIVYALVVFEGLSVLFVVARLGGKIFDSDHSIRMDDGCDDDDGGDCITEKLVCVCVCARVRACDVCVIVCACVCVCVGLPSPTHFLVQS